MEVRKKVREAYMRASSFLRERGVEEHAVTAEMLLQHVLGISRTRLLMQWSDPIGEEAEEVLWTLLQRRALGEPVQYIIGQTYFYGMPFLVTPDVLIPRPETELLVERIAELGSKLWGADGRPLAADIGTGSGAIAVALASKQPGWRLNAVDISTEALKIAKSNAERNGVRDRIEFLAGDLLEPLAREPSAGSIDILVSNPPYIPSQDIGGLQTEVRDYEPHLALDGGADGLDPYRKMLKQMNAYNIHPTLVGFETGMGQARSLLELLRAENRWEHLSIVEDLAGIERHVIAYRTLAN